MFLNTFQQGGSMKWPTQLTIVRHAQSAYNILREKKAASPLYAEFKNEYEKDYRSPRAVELAEEVRKSFSLQVSDAETTITSEGEAMSRITGAKLREKIELPHVVFVSPYKRTNLTLAYMAEKWPELRDRTLVKFVPEDRIREKEHGLTLLYNDWRVFHVMHPEQKELQDLQGPYWYQYPQGESVSDVRERIRSFLGTLIREYAGQRVMLVTHHLTILSIRAILERLSPDRFIDLDENDKPVNCGVTIYRGDPTLGKSGQLVLSEYNTRLY
jgi:broad specificity phosphatase PhoE